MAGKQKAKCHHCGHKMGVAGAATIGQGDVVLGKICQRCQDHIEQHNRLPEDM